MAVVVAVAIVARATEIGIVAESGLGEEWPCPVVGSLGEAVEAEIGTEAVNAG